MLNSLFLALAILGAPAPDKPVPATNTKCPVMNEAVNEKSRTVVVRGREYRVCCGRCVSKLQKDPDKYLEADGTPKNAK